MKLRDYIEMRANYWLIYDNINSIRQCEPFLNYECMDDYRKELEARGNKIIGMTKVIDYFVDD